MRITVLYNPIAGAGKAAKQAEEVCSALAGDGHAVNKVETVASGGNPALDRLLPESEVLVVAGGDGTVRAAAESVLPFGTPIWLFPLGTENLFAREFGMRRDVSQLSESLRSPQFTAMDVGRVNGTLFLMMVSVGFDAEVIHDLASRRTSGITHLTYIGPLIRQIRHWKPAPVRVLIDGEPVKLTAPGLSVVANLRQYAFRLDPAPHAARDDGLIHFIHFPIRSRVSVPLFAIRSRMRRHLRDKQISRASGRHVVLAYDSPQRVQIDGDAMSKPALRLEVSVEPGALRVLRPCRL